MEYNAKIYKYLLKYFIIVNIIFLFGCYPALIREAERPDQALYPVRFFYPEFEDDLDLASLGEAIKKNLEYLDRLDREKIFYYGPDTFTCRQVRDSQQFFLDLILKNPDLKELNKKVKKHFNVYRAAGRAGNRHVLFTGYFEPLFEGSLTTNKTFRHPIYTIPDDLVRIDLSLFHEKFRGEWITARIEGKKVLPYYSRYQIEIEKALKGRNLEIAWLKDPVDVAFLHVQGSGRLKLPDGTIISVGYMTSNGRPYRSIGRYMIDLGYLKREEVSMQSIRKVLSDHPHIIDKVLNYNPSYVFFHRLEDGPLGNISVPLTPGRSIALDARLFPKGALSFISCQKPLLNKEGEITDWANFSRFALNQDTGGAIRGAGRADIFWGNGSYAELAAGHMKHEGELYILIKKPGD